MTGNKQAPLDWEDVRFFAELARRGSLAATARALGVTGEDVATRLDHLERTLGKPLFDRDVGPAAGSLTLTPVGEAALAQAKEMEFAASALSVLRRRAGQLESLAGARACARPSSRPVSDTE